MYFDNHETVRFRVEREEWHDQAPIGPPDPEKPDEIPVKLSPYSITASMADAGLGPCLWWDGEEVQE